MGILGKIISRGSGSRAKPKQKSKKDWWKHEGKDSQGWSPDVDENDPDQKQLNYREKDWED